MRSLKLTMLVVMAVLGTGASASAQSLGDVARQERARRAAKPSDSPRVLTNEDLKRDKILEPRATAPAAAQAGATHTGTQQPSAGELPVVPTLPPSERVVPLWSAAPDVNIAPPPEPTQVTLGDYARQVRAERAARKRVREILAQREQEKAPVIVASPAPPPLPQPRREPALALVPPRPQVRPVKRRAIARRIVLAAAEATDVVTVRRGDSLWKIAQRELGDGRLWTALWQANPEIADPNLIYAGETLRRPAAQLIAQQKTSTTQNRIRAQRRSPASATNSFAARVLGSETRKAAIRTGETLPRPAAPALADPSRRAGPHRSPR